MTLLLLLPAVLCLLALCAHLLREGLLVTIPFFFLLLPLLAIPRGWVARLWQLFLVAAALEWIRTALFQVAERQAEGAPWVRLVVILAAMAAFCLAAASLFEAGPLQRRYPRRPLY